MTTRHRLIVADSRDLSLLPDESVHLVVSSPPYPMIRMWDGLFAGLDPEIAAALERGDGPGAFEAMHRQLDKVWEHLHRLLSPGGMACLNLGDATRRIGGGFRLYCNHSRVLSACLELGFQALPGILWRKPTNSPTKFLGSGTLPPGAYVTLEHEWVLVLRKGGLRPFSSAEERERRRQSSFFWEERNRWFSDLWELTGRRQELPSGPAGGSRPRSGAFPLELASRLVQMYSVQGDTVLDPFLGSGTTLFAAAMLARHSVGVEIDPQLLPVVESGLPGCPAAAGQRLRARLQAHRQFVGERHGRGLSVGHRSLRYGFPVVSRQERDIRLPLLASLRKLEGGGHSGAAREWEARYAEPPAGQWFDESPAGEQGGDHELPLPAESPQLDLFSSSQARGSSSAHGGSCG